MIIDANTHLGRWPFQRFEVNSVQAVARKLNAAGITRALVSSIDSVLYPDPAVTDAELFKAAGRSPMLIPVPTVNLSLANWRERLETKGLKAVKIIPNYHNYRLDIPVAGKFMEALEDLKIPLLVQMRVDDERNQYPLMKVPGVDCGEIVKLANTFTRVPIACLCAYSGMEANTLVQKTKNVSIDISFIKGFRAVPALLRSIPPKRILFGSHTPFLYTESALMKLNNARLTKTQYRSIAHANAERLFGLS